MSVRVIALPNPLQHDRRVERHLPPQRIRDVHRSLGWAIPIDSCAYQVNGKPTADTDLLLVDGDELTIVGIPEGSKDTKEAGSNMKLGGGGLAIIGAVLLATPLAPVGVALIGAGVSTFIGGVILYNYEVPSRQISEQDPAISGSKNQTKTAGEVPLLLGRHRITPHAIKPYTSIIGDDQYLHQLFVVGQRALTVEMDSMRIGSTSLGEYTGVDVEVLQSGNPSSLYPYVTREETVGVTVKHEDSEGVEVNLVRSTASDTREIEVEIVFSSGLLRWKDGDKKSLDVEVRAEYKPLGADPSAWTLMPPFSGATYTITESENRTKRYTSRVVLDNADESGADWHPTREYDVRVRRITGDRTDTKYVDTFAWSALRSIDTTKAPVAFDVASELTLVALRIKASDQLSNVIDKFNLIAQSLARVYSGTGSGPAAWTGDQLTSNPAALWLMVASDGELNNEPTDDDEIDWPTIERWYQFCEEHNYTCNTVLNTGESEDQLLESLAVVGRASSIWIDTKRSVALDAERPAPVQLITPFNSSGYQYNKEFPLLPHALDGQFIDADEDEFAPNNRIVYAPGFTADGAGGTDVATDVREVNLWGCTNADQAYRHLMYQIAVPRLRPETHSVTMGIEYIVATRGDWVRLAHPVPMFGLFQGRVRQLILEAVTDNVVAVILDEQVEMESGKSYGVRIRGARGVWYYGEVVTVEGVTNEVTLVTPWPAGDHPDEPDIFAFGEIGYETVDVIVQSVEPRSDLKARLHLIEYAPDIFAVDDPGFVVPPYDNKITKRTGRGVMVGTVYRVEDELSDIRRAQAQQSGTYPTYDDLDVGWVTPGGTGGVTTPTGVIDFEAISYLRTIQLRWFPQSNLTNLSHHEIQVSDDPIALTDQGAAAWYAPRSDGQDWKGSLNGVESAVPSMFVHEKIPHLGTADNPTSRTLYYRIRQVTKLGAIGPWSEAVTGSTNPLDYEDLAVGTFRAEKALIQQLSSLSADLGTVTTGKLQAPDGTKVTLENGTVEVDGALVVGGAPKSVDQALNDVETNANAYTDQLASQLQGQIDGQIQNWSGEGAPTLSNEPAINWTTEPERADHQNDTYIDEISGQGYRFVSGPWRWITIPDNDIALALYEARTAAQTAAGKSTIYGVQPVPPYYEGDLWLHDGTQSACVVTRVSGSFVAADWEEKLTPAGIGAETPSGAQAKATAAETAAKNYADAEIALEQTRADAYADGVVSTEEQRAINDALLRLTEAAPRLIEIFEEDRLWKWVSYSGSGEVSIVAGDAVTGGRFLRIGNNSGNDERWLIFNQNIPYDPDKLYRISVRARKTAGTGVAYFGVAGVAADGTTFVNVSGANTYGSQHYIAAASAVISSSWATYTGFFKGSSAFGNGGYHPSVDNPATLHENAKYFRLLLLVNYQGQAGITEIDMVEVTDYSTVQAYTDPGATVGAPNDTPFGSVLVGRLPNGTSAPNVICSSNWDGDANGNGSTAGSYWNLATGRLVTHVGNFKGDITGATGAFAGSLDAATGTFAGLLSGGSINIGNGNFTVDPSGHVQAKSASFSGSLSFGSVVNGVSFTFDTHVKELLSLSVPSNNSQPGYMSGRVLHIVCDSPSLLYFNLESSGNRLIGLVVRRFSVTDVSGSNIQTLGTYSSQSAAPYVGVLVEFAPGAYSILVGNLKTQYFGLSTGTTLRVASWARTGVHRAVVSNPLGTFTNWNLGTSPDHVFDNNNYCNYLEVSQKGVQPVLLLPD